MFCGKLRTLLFVVILFVCSFRSRATAPSVIEYGTNRSTAVGSDDTTRGSSIGVVSLVFTSSSSSAERVTTVGSEVSTSATTTSASAEDENTVLFQVGHVHRTFLPLKTRDCIGFLCAILGLIIAAAGGIGGGGILIPIYALILQFPVKYAIPLASVTILGGAIANNVLNAFKTHPHDKDMRRERRRSCIDWILMLQLEPMQMAGALIGADLNSFLPDIVIIVLLLLLLSYTAYKTIQKANQLYHKETEAMSTLALAALSGADEENTPLTEIPDKHSYQSTVSIDVSESEDPYNDKLEDGVYAAWADASLLLGLFGVVTYMNLLKGSATDFENEAGASYDSGKKVGGWILEGLMITTIFGFAIMARCLLLYRVANNKPIHTDIIWNETNSLQYPGLALVAGIAAGLFGIGGGIIMGPLMIALNVHPAVSSATSACMVLFTSATSTISYSTFGLLLYEHAFAFMCLGFLSTIVGQTTIHAIMDHYQRYSYIAYSIGLVVGLSAICMTAESITTLINSV